MPSTYERAIDVTRRSGWLAVVPVAATLLSFSKISRALSSGPGGGVAFPFPTGLPTLWTYVSLPGGPGPGGPSIGGPLSFVAFVPLFLLGLVVTSALEAGFLGSLSRRIDGAPIAFGESVRRFTVRLIGVNIVRALVVLLALPFIVFPPLAFAVVIVLTYLVYGLPFVVVVRDVGLADAFEATVDHARTGGRYAAFGLGHLLAGAAASLVLTMLARNGGLLGVLIGTAVVAVPAVFVGVYGLLVFRELDGSRGGNRSHPGEYRSDPPPL